VIGQRRVGPVIQEWQHGCTPTAARGRKRVFRQILRHESEPMGVAEGSARPAVEGDVIGLNGHGRAPEKRRTPLGIALLRSLRPRQWIKNLFVFAGLIFSERLFTPLVWPAAETFGIFCALSGAIYLVNDVADRAADRLHPDKRHRPIAAGDLTVPVAVGAAVVLLVGALAASARISWALTVIVVSYAVLMLAYSARLKHILIVDVIVVASGFVLRAVAGAVAIRVDISGWLLICTMLVALFLALGKRRAEFMALPTNTESYRPVLSEYSAALLDQMVAVVTASTVTAYALYTMSPETVAKFNSKLMPVTLPFVLYGIFRYLYLLYRRDLGGQPAELLSRDRPLLINALLWAVAMFAIIYGPRLL
jgi:4-hydroxybenzoate polyprenyltransferase